MARLVIVLLPGILSRYVMSRVLLGITLVSLLLVGIHTLIDLIREARSLSGDYGFVQMLWYLLQTTPRRLYDIFPFAALIGTLLGMGGLASGNELVAMRAAGFDRRELVGRVLTAVAVCLFVLMMLAEFAVPRLEATARAERQQARTGQVYLGEYGSLWLRDGPHVVHIAYSAWLADDQLEFGNVLVYTLAEGMRPRMITTAERAGHSGSQWLLHQARQRQVGEGDGGREVNELMLDSGLSPELFAATVSRPRLLSLPDLLEMRAFLERNDLDADRYRQAFWGRLFFPVNVLAMVLIGLPFLFRDARTGGRGLNLFAGVAFGLLFFVLTRLTQGVAMLLPVPLWLSSLLPALMIAALAAVLLRRL